MRLIGGLVLAGTLAACSSSGGTTAVPPTTVAEATTTTPVVTATSVAPAPTTTTAPTTTINPEDHIKAEVRAVWQRLIDVTLACHSDPKSCDAAEVRALQEPRFADDFMRAVDVRLEKGLRQRRGSVPDLDYIVIESIDVKPDGTVSVASCEVVGRVEYEVLVVGGEEREVITNDMIFGDRIRTTFRRTDSWRLSEAVRLSTFDPLVKNECPARPA